MDPISRRELIELAMSAMTFAEAGSGDPGTFQRLQNEKLKSPQEFLGTYLFSLPTWDVFELHNDATVKLFNADELNHSKLRLPTQEGETILRPVPPVLRYLAMTPGSPELEDLQESLKLLDQPHIDRMVVAAIVLTDNDTYIPAGAMYTGTAPEHPDKVAAMQAVFELTEGLNQSLDRRQLVSAPELRVDIEDWISLFRQREFDPHERGQLIQDLSSLDDTSFMEALSQLIPSAWRKNTWIATTPDIAKRAHAIKQSDASIRGKDRGDIRKAPHKTAWMRPAPYEPTIVFRSAEGGASDPRIHGGGWQGASSYTPMSRPHFEREALVDIPRK